MISLGLIGRQMVPYKASASPKAPNETNYSHLLNKYVVRYGRKPSPPSQENATHAANMACRRGWGFESPHRRFGTSSYGGLPPSPSFPRYNSRTRPENVPPTMGTPFADGSFFDEPTDGKRTRALSSLFKPRALGTASGKGAPKLTKGI